jgi:hypothetical protein
MSEADTVLDFDSARVRRGILSGDTDLVESLFRSIEPIEMYRVNANVIHDLDVSINTPRLDVFMKKDLMQQRDTLREIFEKVHKFVIERRKVGRMVEGYPKHQAMMVLLGRDPLSYHEWVDVQEDLHQSTR